MTATRIVTHFVERKIEEITIATGSRTEQDTALASGVAIDLISVTEKMRMTMALARNQIATARPLVVRATSGVAFPPGGCDSCGFCEVMFVFGMGLSVDPPVRCCEHGRYNSAVHKRAEAIR